MACGAEVIYPNLTASSIFPAKSSWLRDAATMLRETMTKHGKCSKKRFVFGPNAIAELKGAEATRNGVQQPTRVEVVSTLIWKCALAATKEVCGFQNTSRLTHLVNLRRKLATKTSKDCLGNMISNAVCGDSDEITLHGLVKKVRESFAKVDIEFVDKAQGDEGYIAMHKWLQENGAMGTINNYLFTSWCNMGFYDIDFGWGKPSWVTGIVGDGMDVFRNFVTLVDTKCHRGVEAWVNLDEEEMKILQCNQELLAYASINPSVLPNDDDDVDDIVQHMSRAIFKVHVIGGHDGITILPLFSQ
ncbi:limonoid 7-O-acetyltransferse-like, partial [Bidens hawaiensis]|uniref:limonoid 7-O-acetyltransferse-like n=1 Tax=Bidens hawaiensis TaxID=980011 RepID=UPI00404A3CC1